MFILNIQIIYPLLSILVFNLGFSQVDSEINFISSDSIENYIKVKNLSFENQDIYVLKNLESFKTYSQGYLKSPVIYVFNSKGNYLDFIHNANAEKKLSNLKKINRKSNKDYPDLKFWREKLIHFNSKQILEERNSDFYFVLNWGFLHNDEESIELINHWYDVLKRHQDNGENIKVVLLNIDLQDQWDLSPESRENVLKIVNAWKKK